MSNSTIPENSPALLGLNKWLYILEHQPWIIAVMVAVFLTGGVCLWQKEFVEDKVEDLRMCWWGCRQRFGGSSGGGSGGGNGSYAREEGTLNPVNNTL
jgi:hypothetical protein